MAAGGRLIETQKVARLILPNVVKATANPCDGSVTPARNRFVVVRGADKSISTSPNRIGFKAARGQRKN
jgi:hypothetical protein